MNWILFSAVALMGYLLGSIPTGFLFGKARGVDIRTLGSGNIGATNVFRFLGRQAGILVLVIDALKGVIACGLVPMLALWVWKERTPVTPELLEYLKITSGVAAILGHNYTCWLRFKGGKGIATSAGVLTGLVPLALLILVGAWLLIFAISRYVSLASVGAAVVLPVIVWSLGYSGLLLGITTALSLLAIYKHRTNIQRLKAGTEHRFGKRATPAPRS